MGKLNDRVGREMRALRKQRGCTLRHVAIASELSLAYLSEIERGSANISLDRLEQLASAFNVDPLVLLGGDSTQYERRMKAENRLEQIKALTEYD